MIINRYPIEGYDEIEIEREKFYNDRQDVEYKQAHKEPKFPQILALRDEAEEVCKPTSYGEKNVEREIFPRRIRLAWRVVYAVLLFEIVFEQKPHHKHERKQERCPTGELIQPFR